MVLYNSENLLMSLHYPHLFILQQKEQNVDTGIGSKNIIGVLLNEYALQVQAVHRASVRAMSEKECNNE